jgi:hypothetical protein
MSPRPTHLRLVEPSRRRREVKPLHATISVNRQFGAYGRSRPFLSERDLRELIDHALRLEARQ